MPKILEMPKLSPTMEEGVLAAWHKKEGDAIAVDDLLAEVETDKATMEFRAFDKGTLLKILVEPGAKVLLGQPVAIVGEKGEDVSGLVPGAAPAADKPKQAGEAAQAKAAADKPAQDKPQPAPSADAPFAQTLAPGAPARVAPKASPGSALDRTSRDDGAAATASAAASSGSGERVLASPYIRKVARERGIDLHGATGSGPGGRLVAADLASLGGDTPRAAAPLVHAGPGSALARPASALAEPDGASALSAARSTPEVRPLSMMRKTIARRLTESKQTVPHFYLTIDVDAGDLAKLREEINAELAQPAKKNGSGDAPPLKVSLNDLLIKACAVALVRVPECNASFSPEAILIHRRVDISVAVAIPDGLVTPVIRNADQKSVVAIASEVRELAAKARAKKLKPEEFQDGTFSISNLGMFGIDSFSAVINPPEGAILAVGQTRDVPVVSNGQVVPGKKLAMTLSCDHRVIDGAVGAAFLAELRALLEHPMRILTG
jgi:pyruvate dehydrogenase E2 component (dihydrolipoamide acetyltransferase)